MHKATHRVLSVDPLTPNTFSLCVERQDLRFVAGQCVNIGLPDTGVNREYSTYSGEQETELRFLIREVEDGDVTPKLRRLRPGDSVEIDGAYGLFTLREPLAAGRRYVFIGTGTGIAPFHCFVKSYPALDYTIIHGVRDAAERYGHKDYARGRYLACVSREAPPEGEGIFRGRVTDYLRGATVDTDATYYLCGNRNMINDVYDLLRERGVSSSSIVTEVFF